MRKLYVSLVAAVAVMAVVASPVGARSKRFEEANYARSAGIYVGDLEGTSVMSWECGSGGGCVEFPVPAGATTVSIEIADDSGNTVVGVVLSGEGAEACGATEDPVPLGDSEVVYVVVATGTCTDGTFSLPTAGTVTATFG